nr:FMN-binding split barrel [Tanacetum cinerariifolium]
MNHFHHLLLQRASARGAAVVVALSANTHEPQEEKEDEDEDDTNTNVIDEETKTKEQVVAAAALSTPLDHPPITPATTNSSQHATTGTTSTRAGLFRTPISGGVQSATSVHDLPPPPLAVRNLMEQARFAHLCTVMSRMHHRREGYPFGSLVDFATDAMGHPIFSFSPLAIHTRNLLADPRCTLVVQIPGWSGLSNARVTIFGDVFPLPEDQQEWAHQQYISKHHQGPSQKWGNFYYFRMQNISEYEALRPDKIAVDGGEQNLKELNAIFSKPIKELLSLETEVDDAALISIDSKGTDVRVRQGAQRRWVEVGAQALTLVLQLY